MNGSGSFFCKANSEGEREAALDHLVCSKDCETRCRVDVAHMRQPQPDLGLGVQVKVFKTFEVVSSSIQRAAHPNTPGFFLARAGRRKKRRDREKESCFTPSLSCAGDVNSKRNRQKIGHTFEPEFDPFLRFTLGNGYATPLSASSSLSLVILELSDTKFCEP